MGNAVYKAWIDVTRLIATLNGEIPVPSVLWPELSTLAGWRLVNSPIMNPVPLANNKVVGAVISWWIVLINTSVRTFIIRFLSCTRRSASLIWDVRELALLRVKSQVFMMLS